MDTLFAELVNDGSREITDVTLTVEFVDAEKTVLDSLQVTSILYLVIQVSGDK